MTVKQTAKIIIFISAFILLLTAVTYMLRTNGEQKDRFVGFYAEPENSIDAIVIGSSPVSPSIAAAQIYGETGIVLYPLSTNLQRPIAQLWLTKEALKYQSPKLMLYEVRMYTGIETDMTSNMAYTRGVTDNLKYSLNRIETIRAMTGGFVQELEDVGDKDPLTYYFDIFKYHSNWRSLSQKGQWLSFAYTWPDENKGWEVHSDVNPCTLTDYSGVTDSVPIPEQQEKYLLELFAYLKEQDQEALFFVSPYEPENEEHAAMYNYLRDLAEANGFDFLNMNDYREEIGISAETDYYDEGHHTNALGSRKVSVFLENYLKEHYELPDHREEADYRSWDSAYEKWQRDSEAAIEEINAETDAAGAEE